MDNKQFYQWDLDALKEHILASHEASKEYLYNLKGIYNHKEAWKDDNRCEYCGGDLEINNISYNKGNDEYCCNKCRAKFTF